MELLPFLLRASVYIMAFVVSYYALGCLNYEKLLKANHVAQAQILYFLLVMSLAYLIGSFVLVFVRF